MKQSMIVKFASTVLAIAGTMSFVTTAAHAQKGSDSFQPYEGAVTFTYDYTTKAPGSPTSSVNLIGGSGSVAYYGSPRLAAVADYSQTYKNNLPGPSFQGGGPVSLRESTYLFGPRVSFPKAGSKLTPYAQALLGLTHDTGSAAQTSLFSGYGGTQDYTHSTISFGVGGGLDYKVKKHITFRVVQLEYVLNTLPTTAGNTKENNIRVDTGLVVRF